MKSARRTAGVRTWLVMLVAMLAFAPLFASAQESTQEPASNKNVASIWMMWVKPGQSANFEKAFRQHAAWRKKSGENMSWQVFQPVAGDDLAHYVVYTGNHAWSEFDGSEKWDTDSKATDKFVEQVGGSIDRYSHYFGTEEKDLSYWPETAANFSLLEVMDLKIAPGKYGDFRKALATFKKAAESQKWSHYWSISSQTGGSTDATVVFPHANYADMAQPTPSFMAMLGKQLGGNDKAMSTMTELQKSIAQSNTTLYLYRPDLSTPSD